MAIASSVALTFLASRLRDTAWMERMVASEVPAALIAVPVFTGATIFWTTYGLVAGAAYEVLDLGGEPTVLGSPVPWLVGMAGIAFIPLPLLLLTWPRYWWLWLSMSGLYLATFGWLMPALASQ